MATGIFSLNLIPRRAMPAAGYAYAIAAAQSEDKLY